MTRCPEATFRRRTTSHPHVRMSLMDLHVILGPPGSGKAGRAVARLRDDAARGLDAFLVVPGAIDRARFLRELGGGDERVLLGVEVGTFDQLVARIAGSPPVRRTDRMMERVVVRDALARVGGRLGAIAAWSGFVETARAQVDRLRRARTWGGAELARVEEELPGASVDEWRAVEDAVEALLRERRLRDDAWFEQRASDAIRADACGVGSVVVYGFESLPEHRIALLERLATRVPVTVSLAWRPGRLVHERAATLRDRWRARGAFIEEVDGELDAHPTLAWLGDELFEQGGAAPPTVQDEPGSPAPIAFVDCCGPMQEADEVVREVALLGARGYAWDDIAVASASASQDAELLVAAFERAGIPARVQARRTATDVPAGRALHDVLAAACDDDAIGLVGAVRAPVFDLDVERLDALELQLRAVRERSWTPLADERVRRSLTPAIHGLLDARGDRPGAVQAMRDLLASMAPADVGELDLLRGVAAGIEGLTTAAGGERHVRLTDLRDAVASFPLAVADRSDTGVVVIASIDDLRSVTYPAVVLRGMHHGGFRAQVDVDAEAPAAARDLLHLAVTRARGTLRVVRQAASASGAELAPSPGWVELRSRVPDAPLRMRRLGEVLVAPDQVRISSEVAASVALALGQASVVDAVPDATRARIDAAQRTSRRTPVADPLRGELASIHRIAATGIESYATCSAKWFIEKRLRATDPDDDRSRLVEGNLAHALLQELAAPVRLEGEPHDLDARARALAEQLLPGIDRQRLLDAPRVERVVDNVVAVLRTELTEAWDRPDQIAVEQLLDSEDPQAFAPGLRLGDVEVTGRVDRIDQYGSHVVLHDYKYRSTSTSVQEMLDDHRLQLLVYWLALHQAGSPVEPIGALYRAVTDAGSVSGAATPAIKERSIISSRRRSGVLDPEQLDALLEAARTVLDDAITALRSGEIRPLASPDLCPTYCRLQSICRVGEATS